MTVAAAFVITILSLWTQFHSDGARQATVEWEGGKTQSKLLEQEGNLSWYVAGKPRSGPGPVARTASAGSCSLPASPPLLSCKSVPFPDSLSLHVGKRSCGHELKRKP